MNRITNSLPSFELHNQHWDHLQGLQLADPEFLVPSDIDILLGADVYGELIQSEVRKGGHHDPIAQLTHFGWVILGPTEDLGSSPVISSHVSVEHDDIRDILIRFWEQEEVPITNAADLTPEEAECEEHFQQTHSRDSSGRYIVRLPLISPLHELGESYTTLHACLNRLIRRISRDANYHQLYSDFLTEYESLGHMIRVPDNSRSGPAIGGREGGKTLAHAASASGGLRVPHERSSAQTRINTASYYLPHHGVLKPQSKATKLRAVFNGSSKTQSGKSLNDILHTGAKLQRDITDVLLWSRQHKFIFMTDITKMFRQIRVHKDDWPLQKILWIDANGQEAEFHLTTVTYGTRPAPFLSVRVLLQLVEDEGHKYPLAVAPLKYGQYVDDICGGEDSSQELIQIAEQVQGLCSAGGFPLAKSQSN